MIFSKATAARRAENGEWLTEVQPGWDIGGNANGGYLLALAGRAMANAAERPDVASLTAHYLRPGIPGPHRLQANVAKTGRRFTTVQGTLTGEKPVLSLVGSFTDHAETTDDRSVMLMPPIDLPDPDRCIKIEATDTFPPPVMGKVDLRLHPDDSFYDGPSGTPQMRGWVRLLDDEPLDSVALLLISDIFPPTVFNANFNVAWVPTLELTVHVRNRPVPGWLRCEFTSRFVTGGFVEEDGLMWDENDTLVAQSRQIALLPRD